MFHVTAGSTPKHNFCIIQRRLILATNFVISNIPLKKRNILGPYFYKQSKERRRPIQNPNFYLHGYIIVRVSCKMYCQQDYHNYYCVQFQTSDL